MDNDTVTLLLGLTFGLAVVGVAIGLFILMGRTQTSTVAMSYNNEEKWDVVKDDRGRVKAVVVHSEAKVQ